MNTYYVELNFCGNQVIDTGIAISQGDYGQVQFSIATKKDGQYISDAQSAEIVFKLSNGYIVNGTMTGAGGLYSYIFQGNELQSAGKTVATVILHYADGRVSSESFTFSVRYNPLYDRGIEAGPYITQLESIREQAQGYVDYLEILISQLREDVEATALTKADLQNDFLQTQPGFKALDAAVGSQIVQTSHIDNNLTGTDPTHVLASPQGKKLEEEITQLKSEMITITTKDYEVTLTSSGGSSWGYSYGFSLVENGDLPTRTQLVIPIACGLKANWNTTGMVSVHQNDFVRVASNTGGIFDLRLAFISRRAPD